MPGVRGRCAWCACRAWSVCLACLVGVPGVPGRCAWCACSVCLVCLVGVPGVPARCAWCAWSVCLVGVPGTYVRKPVVPRPCSWCAWRAWSQCLLCLVGVPGVPGLSMYLCQSMSQSIALDLPLNATFSPCTVDSTVAEPAWCKRLRPKTAQASPVTCHWVTPLN